MMTKPNDVAYLDSELSYVCPKCNDKFIEKERVREAIKKFESYACETSCSIGYTIAEELLKELGLEDG